MKAALLITRAVSAQCRLGLEWKRLDEFSQNNTFLSVIYKIKSNVMLWTEHGFLASLTLRSCETLGPASVFFLLVVVMIPFCRVESIRNNTGSSQHSASTWWAGGGSKWEPWQLSQVGEERYSGSQEAVAVEGQRGCRQRLQAGSWGALVLGFSRHRSSELGSGLSVPLSGWAPTRGPG